MVEKEDNSADVSGRSGTRAGSNFEDFFAEARKDQESREAMLATIVSNATEWRALPEERRQHLRVFSTKLSGRKAESFKLLDAGMRPKDIAERLGTSLAVVSDALRSALVGLCWSAEWERIKSTTPPLEWPLWCLNFSRHTDRAIRWGSGSRWTSFDNVTLRKVLDGWDAEGWNLGRKCEIEVVETLSRIGVTLPDGHLLHEGAGADARYQRFLRSWESLSPKQRVGFLESLKAAP